MSCAKVILADLSYLGSDFQCLASDFQVETCLLVASEDVRCYVFSLSCLSEINLGSTLSDKIPTIELALPLPGDAG